MEQTTRIKLFLSIISAYLAIIVCVQFYIIYSLKIEVDLKNEPAVVATATTITNFDGREVSVCEFYKAEQCCGVTPELEDVEVDDGRTTSVTIHQLWKRQAGRYGNGVFDTCPPGCLPRRRRRIGFQGARREENRLIRTTTSTTTTTTTPFPDYGYGEKAGGGGYPGQYGQAGVAGFPGGAGPPGPPGMTGGGGWPGGSGMTGEAGMPGPPGWPGEPGMRGENGMPGPPGMPGGMGGSGGMGMAGEPGMPGMAGEPGMPGMSGGMGMSGSPGMSGMAGMPGPPGMSGMAGMPGPPGMSGMNGMSGMPGMGGMAGLQGPPGQRGNPGATINKGYGGMTNYQGPASSYGSYYYPGGGYYTYQQQNYHRWPGQYQTSTTTPKPKQVSELLRELSLLDNPKCKNEVDHKALMKGLKNRGKVSFMILVDLQDSVYCIVHA